MRMWLRERRIQSGHSQEDMAEKLGISQAYYCAIEHGLRKKSLDLRTAQSIADVFGVPIEDVIRLEGEAQDAQHKDSA